MAEDFDAILARADSERWARLGEDVTYTPPGGAGTTVRAIWHSEAEVGSSPRGGVETRVTTHAASLRYAEVTPERRATITRKGRDYQVMTVHPDSDRQSALVTLKDMGATA